MVNQVCWAEGTVAFIKLDEIFLKVDPFFVVEDVVQPNLPNITEQSDAFQQNADVCLADSDLLRAALLAVIKSTSGFRDPRDSIANKILEEALQCATDLFNSDDRKQSAAGRHATEQNVFINVVGEYTIPTSVRLDPSIRDIHGQLLSNLNSGLNTATIDKLYSDAEENLDNDIIECYRDAFCTDNSPLGEYGKCLQDAYDKNFGDLFKGFAKGLVLEGFTLVGIFRL